MLASTFPGRTGTSSQRGTTHNFGVFAALPQLLNGVGVFHIIHGDRVHHHHSVILTGEQIQVEKLFITNCNAEAGDCGIVRDRWETHCRSPSAGPPFRTSEMTMEVSPLWKWGLSRPPEMAIPNPNPGACKQKYTSQKNVEKFFFFKNTFRKR